jgi:hypothetical protein
MQLARVMLTDPDRGATIARELSSICRQSSAAAADQEIWDGAAAVFQAIAESKTLAEVFAIANSFDSKHQALRALGYLASTIVADAQSAFRAQIAVIETVVAWYPSDAEVYTKLLVPYVEEYWTQTFERGRFQFSSPGIVEENLAAAKSALASERIKATLRAVAPSFSTRGLEAAREWLMR